MHAPNGFFNKGGNWLTCRSELRSLGHAELKLKLSLSLGAVTADIIIFVSVCNYIHTQQTTVAQTVGTYCHSCWPRRRAHTHKTQPSFATQHDGGHADRLYTIR